MNEAPSVKNIISDVEPMIDNELLDFKSSISDLHRRSAQARKIQRFVGAVLVTFCLIFSAYVVNQFTSTDRLANFREIAQKMRLSADLSSEQVFLRPANEVLRNLYPDVLANIATKLDTGKDVPTEQLPANQRSERIAEVTKLVELYERAEKARSTAKPPVATDNIAPIISTTVLTAGAVAILVLLIQIGVMFMRYYAQLAEHYDTQAFALEASQGRMDRAFEFVEHFSTKHILLGKQPVTLYEKSLDTIAELARSKLKA
ncbi:hypothetical protein BLA50215_00837 [Burkholderia lata]|uniref:hypothetical protein n=1 Tax=Burkholderia lata (strain ATCC 17760 / DSM 23089 / LMG 22485 / NCIMB 9086 / R18194 / 383) TaxID=482957 RepID=UPI001453150D|nr:hypothetical protein [Burkholderia lata]VWC74887.1 hypothetical protein BLA50215_00837 [Burkholderia lata]